MAMRKTFRSVPFAALALLGAFAAGACDEGGASSSGSKVSRHPLAGAIQEIMPRIQGLADSEKEELDSFLRFSTARAAVLETRKACELVGRGLRDAGPELIADFVLCASEHLYDDFFRNLPVGRLAEVAAAIEARTDVSELDALRLAMLIRDRGGMYQATLARAMSGISFHTAVAPEPVPAESLLPEPSAVAGEISGAAEALRTPSLVKGGASPGLAVEILQKGRGEFPADPLLIAGLVSVFSAHPDLYGSQLERLLVEAEGREPDNAAYTYLRASHAFQRGLDDEALSALRSAAEREKVTFHTFERAGSLYSFLRKKGYGELRARICSLKTLSDPLYFDLKLLANAALKRSQEYLETRPKEDLDTVLALPETLDRQMEGQPHPEIGQRIRWTILLNGLQRLAEYHDRRDPDRSLAQDCLARARELALKLETVERGEEVCSGREIWGPLYDLLGEKKFVKYLSGVLLGNEAEFHERCAGMESLKDCLELTQQEYRFD